MLRIEVRKVDYWHKEADLSVRIDYELVYLSNSTNYKSTETPWLNVTQVGSVSGFPEWPADIKGSMFLRTPPEQYLFLSEGLTDGESTSGLLYERPGMGGYLWNCELEETELN